MFYVGTFKVYTDEYLKKKTSKSVANHEGLYILRYLFALVGYTIKENNIPNVPVKSEKLSPICAAEKHGLLIGVANRTVHS